MSQLTTQQTFGLAIQHHQAGRLREAEQLYRQILAREPEHIHAMHHLGVIAFQMGHSDIAVGLIRQAVALQPNYPEAYCNLGNALRAGRQFDEAIAAYHQAIVLGPDFAEAHLNLANALNDKGELDKALTACRQAIALKPSYAEAHFNLALMLLRMGDFYNGWKEHEWRWEWKGFSSPRRNFSQPQWNGGSLEGHTILLHTEQGFGDAIQFIRYVPLVAQRGGKIIIECQVELQRLFRTMPEGCQIVTRGEPLPAFDVHCPLLSLPLIFGTTLE